MEKSYEKLKNRILNRENLYLVLAIICVILGVYNFEKYATEVKDTHCLTTQLSSRILDLNTFDLEVSPPLDLAEFKILNKNSGKAVLANSKSKKGIKNEYGYCSFELFWREKKIYEIGHFKFNNWHTNNYKLSVNIKNDVLEPNLEIYGPDSGAANIFYRKINE
ncbi:MAG: hypothetical protein R2798_14470 [Chitinophagales bacterium]|nr:hypothetical protein [Bacteroidota bacterium]MCB9043493.1 hypothetical protein [Chitinophagales bacterium]